MEELDIKERILKGTEELLIRYGARSISMDDIARHLTVSKKTLYQHFADKEELVTAVLFNHLECDKKEFEEIQSQSTDAVDELAKISVWMKHQMEKTNPGLLFDLQKYHPKAWNVWLEFKNKFIYDSIVRNLKQGIKEANFRADISPEILTIMRIELIQLVFDPSLFPSDKFKLAHVQQHVFEHFVYGLVTEKGRKLYENYKMLTNQSTPVL